MFLLAESGATRSRWALMGKSLQPKVVELEGFNPNYHSAERLLSLVQMMISQLPDSLSVSGIMFYGAGCSGRERAEQVRQLLSTFFVSATITVEGDLTAAARGLLYDQPGIVLILGTGSNAGLYDGSQIVGMMPSLGYMLGDEGSGSHMGRLLVREYITQSMPADVARDFEIYTGHNIHTLIPAIYSHKAPGNFLASLAPFLSTLSPANYAQSIVSQSFNSFFRQLKGWLGSTELKGPLCMSASGSIAWHFEAWLRNAAEVEGYRLNQISESPFKGLIAYHQQYLSE